jgi:hypothetical protein
MALPAGNAIRVDIQSNRRLQLSLSPKLSERRNDYGEQEGSGKAERVVPHQLIVVQKH